VWLEQTEKIVGFTAVERKQQLLAEGVIFKPNGKIDMKQCSWRQLFF
jgi:methylated-DNA-protein-cysteine methyltransferase-like protein